MIEDALADEKKEHGCCRFLTDCPCIGAQSKMSWFLFLGGVVPILYFFAYNLALFVSIVAWPLLPDDFQLYRTTQFPHTDDDLNLDHLFYARGEDGDLVAAGVPTFNVSGFSKVNADFFLRKYCREDADCQKNVGCQIDFAVPRNPGQCETDVTTIPLRCNLGFCVPGTRSSSLLEKLHDAKPHKRQHKTTIGPEEKHIEVKKMSKTEVDNLYKHRSKFRGKRTTDFSKAKSYQYGLPVSMIEWLVGSGPLRNLCSNVNDLAVRPSVSRITTFNTLNDYLNFGANGGCGQTVDLDLEVRDFPSGSSAFADDPVSRMTLHGYFRGAAAGQPEITADNPSPPAFNLNDNCFTSNGLQQWADDSRTNNIGGAVFFNTFFYCNIPPDWLLVVTEASNILINIILIFLLFRYELKEFNWGLRPVWYERFAVQIVRTFCYWLFAGMLLGDLSNPTMTLLSFGMAGWMFFWGLVHLWLTVYFLPIRDTDEPMLGLLGYAYYPTFYKFFSTKFSSAKI